MIKYKNSQFILSLFVCALPLALVVGAAVMEFFIILSCFTFFFLNYKKIGLNYYKNNFCYIFLAFSFYLIISSILSENIYNSLKSTLFYFRFGVLIVLIWYLLDNFEGFKSLFFYSMIITLSIVIGYSIIDFIFLYDEKLTTRLSGLFGEEQVQGSYLLRISPIFFLSYLYNKIFLSSGINFSLYIMFFLIIIFIILSGERAAIFLMFIAMFLIFIFFKMKLKKIFTYLMLLSLLLVVTFATNPGIKKRILEKTYKEFFYTQSPGGKYDFSSKKIQFFSQGHQGHFKSALIMFKQNYIKGVGVRNFRKECKKDIYKKVGRYSCTNHPHNTYLQLLSETGLIGFLFFLIFIGFIFTKASQYLINIYIRNKKINVNQSICFVFILINFFPLATTGSFFNNWLSTLYFMPIAFLLHELNYKKIK